MEDLYKEYEFLFDPKVTYVAFGNLGTWGGEISFCLSFKGNQKETEPYFLGFGDYPSVEVSIENGRLLIESATNDGISRYEIRRLKPDGVDFLKENSKMPEEEKIKVISERYSELLF